VKMIMADCASCKHALALAQSLTSGFNAWPDKIAFSPDGSRLLLTAWQSNSRLWDVPTGAEIANLRGHKSDIVCGTFSHDGRLAATASFDGAARLWDALTGNLRRILGEEIYGQSVFSPDQYINCAFSPDDRLLATASADGKVYVWDVETGSQFSEIRGSGDFVKDVEFSPVDRSLITASHDGTARLWDVDGILTTSLFHKYPPTFAVFSPDNVHLLTGGGDNLAHLWDIPSGREIAALQTHLAVQGATFSPDGGRVATSSLEGKILIWDIASRREVGSSKVMPGSWMSSLAPTAPSWSQHRSAGRHSYWMRQMGPS
jgi:WD40 repeat protein